MTGAAGGVRETRDGGKATDAALVAASRAGDRDAFTEIVTRYQGLVCAITCAGAGGRAAGDELAQETFLAAWRSLGELRDPGRLRGWLAGIARNLIANAARRRPPEMTSSAAEVAGTDPSPLERAIAGEERALLWRELAALPAAYREPLVLFYWEDRSVERVAAALELDEQTVRQRLSRGRRMLREQLLALADRELVRARPRREFAVAVVAALPTGVPGATATVGAAKATGLSGAGAVGMGAALGGAVAGSLVGLAGAYVGALASIRGTRSPRERQLMVRMAWLMAAVTLGFAALDVAVAMLAPDLLRSLWWHGATLVPFTVLVVALVLRTNRRRREIQVEDGTFVAAPPPSGGERRFRVLFIAAILGWVGVFFVGEEIVRSLFPVFADTAYAQLTLAVVYGIGLLQLILWGSRGERARLETGMSPPPAGGPGATPRVIYSSLAGGVVGACCWIFPLCWLARDWLTGLAVVAVAAGALAVGGRAAVRHPERYFSIASRVTLVVGGAVLVAMNLRWELWMEAYRASELYQASADLPLWVMNLLLVFTMAWVELRLRQAARAAAQGASEASR